MPANHSLAKREFEHYDSVYRISDYSQKELPFCVTIMSHNNIQNNRYKRVMLSLTNQQYSNYRVVFLDDNSDDGNIEGTRRVMEELGFPKDRIVYVVNKERKFATYNIVHAAHSYCREEEIQLLLDGDD